jgi:hypothetical protein
VSLKTIGRIVRSRVSGVHVAESRSALDTAATTIRETSRTIEEKDRQESVENLTWAEGDEAGTLSAGSQAVPKQAADELLQAPGKQEPKRPQPARDKKLEARDKWLYRQYFRGVALKLIKSNLAEKCGEKDWQLKRPYLDQPQTPSSGLSSGA